MPDRTISPEPQPENHSDEAALTRRQSLKAVARYAAFVAPAMTVLVSGNAEAAPNCDNPGLHLGVKRNGHSGC